MSALAEIDNEREEGLNQARDAYHSAYQHWTGLMDKYPIAHRTLSQMDEISKAEGVCIIKNLHYTTAKHNRYRVAI